jgi:hypothetical protein
LNDFAHYPRWIRSYACDDIRFARLDVGKFPMAAKEYNLNDSASSTTDLPALALFHNGTEIARVPAKEKGWISNATITLTAVSFVHLHQPAKSNVCRGAEQSLPTTCGQEFVARSFRLDLIKSGQLESVRNQLNVPDPPQPARAAKAKGKKSD